MAFYLPLNEREIHIVRKTLKEYRDLTQKIIESKALLLSMKFHYGTIVKSIDGIIGKVIGYDTYSNTYEIYVCKDDISFMTYSEEYLNDIDPSDDVPVEIINYDPCKQFKLNIEFDLTEY